MLAALLRNSYDLRCLTVLLRAPSDAAAAERLRGEVLGDRAFADLDTGELRDRLDDGRLRALAGDLESAETGSTEALHGVDVVIHCAATVSFEEPLDDALALNSLGPRRLLERLLQSGSRPHFVHVSTAYVADRRSGVVNEDGVTHHALADLDPEDLLAAAAEWRAAAERESRAEGRLRDFAKAAERDAARRPGLDATARAEEARARWVQQRLSKLGRRHAQQAGWPDTYAFSKALGERLLLERSERTTIVRPTIIESALERPFPGWLEGIKVADPLILAYAARGLTHLPGRRSNRIDIVPVDHVANACIAAAAHPPEQAPRAIAVAQHRSQPARDRRARRPDQDLLPGAPAASSPVARRSRSGRSSSSSGGPRCARRSAANSSPPAWRAWRSPRRSRCRRSGLLRGNRAGAERITRMVKIYGAYTELDCVFDDSNAQALFRSLPPADREELPFDTAAIDWDAYLQEIHLPQVRRLAGGG